MFGRCGIGSASQTIEELQVVLWICYALQLRNGHADRIRLQVRRYCRDRLDNLLERCDAIAFRLQAVNYINQFCQKSFSDIGTGGGCTICKERPEIGSCLMVMYHL